MSDPNLQVAAHSIRQAADEAQRQLNNITSDLNLKIRENEKHLDEIRIQEGHLKREMLTSQNSQSQDQHAALLKRASDEENQIKRAIDDLKAQVDQHNRNMQSRISRYNDLAKQIDNMG